MRNSMKEQFKGYSSYTDKEYQEIWREAAIVIDTNILLNFYRYSSETRKELYSVLKNVKERLWIPYQVASEYFKNKENVMVDTNKDFDKLISETNGCFTDIINKVNGRQIKRLKCKDKLLKTLEESKESIEKIIREDKEQSLKDASEENVEKIIFELFNNSVGMPFNDEKKEELKKEGKRRMESQIPPGFKDSDKEENGDYYIFYSIIQFAKENNKHIIFITDDTKEDWFVKRQGQIKSGEYRLLNEFYKETGKLLLIYTSDGFVESYQNNIDGSKVINENVINELKATRKEEKNSFINNQIKFYRNRINNIIKYLYDYRTNSKEENCKEIENLIYILDRMGLYNDSIRPIIEILKVSIKKGYDTEVVDLLNQLTRLISIKTMHIDKKEDNLLKNKYNDFEKGFIINKIRERDRLYNKLYRLIDQVGLIQEHDVSRYLNKINFILNNLNENPNLSEIDIRLINSDIDEMREEIEKSLKDNFSFN